MTGPSLSIGLVLGSLLMFVFQPTATFTVKLLGNDNTFGETRVGNSDREKEEPIPNENNVLSPVNETMNNFLTSDEISLNTLSAKEDITDDEIDEYLIKYGYLKPSPNGVVSEEERKEAIREFQRFTKVHQTGIIDVSTVKKMRRARCGLADPVSNSRFANFDAKGTRKWSKKDLTYRIIEYSNKLPKSIVRETTAKAFKMWSDVSQLTFTEVTSGSSDMKLRFTPRRHGDGAPFDGKGGVLAHAFYPQSGEIHMEEEENWTVKSKKGINLLFVLVHEIGHSLGLGHSNVNEAIMEPFYNGYNPNLKLNHDDIAGVQFLYGKPETPVPATKAPTTKAPTTKAPTTKAPITEAPTTKVPTTKAPITEAPTTKAPTTKAPITEVPTTNAPTTKAPITEAPATNAPTTQVPATKTHIPEISTTQVSTTEIPVTKYPESTFQPQTTEPNTPKRIFPCPFGFWAAMTVGNRTFGFRRRFLYEIENGRIISKRPFRYIFRKAPYYVGAAAHNDISGQTFLFRGRYAFRYTDNKLDSGFPKRLRYFIRSAVVVDDQLIAFSFSRVHYLDQDTMEDYVDGEVSIMDEYPGLRRNIRAIVSYGDGFAYVFYTFSVVKLDIYSGELTEERCRRN